ncbi:MAG: ABC transporter permease [Lachnospiraceae bacterium]|nr:ABC transporter permease [Lachnospiraceae bacterium]MBR1876055.1 ABC transporter permease [Lachnospiraceae bacterium]
MSKKSNSKIYWNKLKNWPLLLPVIALILVMAVNIIHDAAIGENPLSFFMISLRNTTTSGTILYGRIIDIINRGSEVAILAIGMTLVVSASAGTDISVGSVMSLCASFMCMMLAGYGVSSTTTLAMPLAIGLLCAVVMGIVCGAFNGTLVAHLKIQPMVATLILYSAARAIGLLLCNDLIVYVRNPSFAYFGAFTGPIPTPIIITAICIIIVSLVLKKTALGMYIQSVGINARASRIAGLNSRLLIFLAYTLCGLFAAIAGIVASSRITSADSNNIGLYLEMDAILSVALGGNSLGGGKFNLAGSIIGAYTIQAITTTLYALGVSTNQAPVFKAIIVILIVVIEAPPFKAFVRKFNASRAAAREV